MKKKLVLFLALITCTSILSACGGNISNNNSNNTSSNNIENTKFEVRNFEDEKIYVASDLDDYKSEDIKSYIVDRTEDWEIVTESGNVKFTILSVRITINSD